MQGDVEEHNCSKIKHHTLQQFVCSFKSRGNKLSCETFLWRSFFYEVTPKCTFIPSEVLVAYVLAFEVGVFLLIPQRLVLLTLFFDCKKFKS